MPAVPLLFKNVISFFKETGWKKICCVTEHCSPSITSFFHQEKHKVIIIRKTNSSY